MSRSHRIFVDPTLDLDRDASVAAEGEHVDQILPTLVRCMIISAQFAFGHRILSFMVLVCRSRESGRNTCAKCRMLAQAFSGPSKDSTPTGSIATGRRDNLFPLRSGADPTGTLAAASTASRTTDMHAEYGERGMLRTPLPAESHVCGAQ